MWHHTACEGISMEVYNFLSFNEEKARHWYCAKCNIVVGELVKQVTQLSNRQDKLEHRMQELEVKSEEQHQELKEDITTIRLQATAAMDVAKEQVRKEREALRLETRAWVTEEAEATRATQDRWMRDVSDRVYNELKNTL